MNIAIMCHNRKQELMVQFCTCLLYTSAYRMLAEEISAQHE